MIHRSLAKTTQPTAAGAMPRLRLFHRLDGGPQRRITWVWGPPGAGKTTLVASYLATRRLRALWYQVDAGDADAATLFYYLGRAAPRRRRHLPLLTTEYRSRLDVFARGFFRQLYERLKPPFVLVLDNYQEAPADALLHEFLREAATELPEGGRIVVVSRAGPPSTMARLRLHQELDIIDWTALRLTPAEATRLAGMRAKDRPTEAALRRLYELADGWFAGLVLLLGSDRADPAASRRLAPSQLLFDYFAGEIFRKSDPRTQQILLETSFLPSVTAATAHALTGRRDAGEVIADLHRKNFFTNKRAGPDGAWEYHPLFREFLLTEARRTLSADRIAAVHQAAAALLEEAGEVEGAAELLRQASAWEDLAALICRHAPVLLGQGRVETVERWLASVPEPVFAVTPWLLHWRATCHLGRRPQDCAQDAERALAAFRQQRDVDGTRLAWSLIVLNQILAGWLDLVDIRVAQLDELLEEVPGRGSPPAEARVAMSMVLAIAYRLPSHPDRARWLARLLELTRSQPDIFLRTPGTSIWVLYHFQRGDAAKVALVVEDLKAIARRRDISSVVVLHATFPVVCHEVLLALPSYRQTVAAMSELARSTGLRHVLCLSVICWGAFAALSDGDLETASAWIQQVEDEIPTWGPVYRVVYLGLRILEALARDDLEAAIARERELGELGYTSGMLYDEVLARVTASYVCQQQGRYDEVRDHLRRALEIGALIENPYLEWIAGLADAWFLLEQGRDGEGIEALRRAMTLGRRGGYVNSPVWRPAMMARLCARALEVGIEPEYLRELIKRRRLWCEPPPLSADSWPWPVKIFALGRFEVLSDARPPRSSGKVQRKPLALLRALIVPGKPRHREERLMDLLWPDSDGDAARRALTSTVFRLRRLLGHDAAVVRGGGQISLNPTWCWVDAWAVERMLDEAGAASAADAWPDATRWTEAAAALYRGPLFDGGDDAAWCRHAADRLRTRLLRALLLLVQHWEDAGQQSRAAEFMEIARRVDPRGGRAASVTDP